MLEVRNVRLSFDGGPRDSEVRAFFRRGGSRAREHQRFFEALEARGHDIAPLAFRTLVAQDGMTKREALAGLTRDGLEGRERSPQTVICDAMLDYLRPGFHRWHVDNSELARRLVADVAHA